MRILRRPTPDAIDETFDWKPTKVVAIGVNYRAHAEEMGKLLPEEPLLFLKPPSALVGNEADIRLPGGYERIDHEAELGVVMVEQIRACSPEEAGKRIMGFTCVNDVSVRDLQKRDGQWARAKGFDTFCPVGPRIVGGLVPDNLKIQCRLNGELRQSSTTADMIFSVLELVSFVSHVMTLEPDDLLLTGTPQGVGPMKPGDTVEVEIAGIGVLTNAVVARET